MMTERSHTVEIIPVAGEPSFREFCAALRVLDRQTKEMSALDNSWLQYPTSGIHPAYVAQIERLTKK